MKDTGKKKDLSKFSDVWNKAKPKETQKEAPTSGTFTAPIFGDDKTGRAK